MLVVREIPTYLVPHTEMRCLMLVGTHMFAGTALPQQ